MLLLKHGSIWLVIFLLLGVRSSDSADIPENKKEKIGEASNILYAGGEEVTDGGGGTAMELVQFQADSGGYRNNSDPAPEHHPEEIDLTETAVTEGDTTSSNFDEAASKTEQIVVESSTHQEEMTFGEEFEGEERNQKRMEEENTERSSMDREVQSGSTVFEVVAEKEPQKDGSLKITNSNFPQDIGADESNHEGYNEDAILYFESKRYKGLKKKNHGNSKIREMSNSIAVPMSSNKERVHITSYVADITEVDDKNNMEEQKAASKPPPRDATTISTFLIAPKETVSHRTPIRIRKKIIKPVRLGYRKKQNQQSNQVPSDSQSVFRQKVALFEPPPPRNNKLESEKNEPTKPESTTEMFNVYHEDIIDHIDLPLEDKNYLPLRPVNMMADSGPYIPPPQIEIEPHLPRTPEQYLREEITKFQINENLSPVLPTALPPESSIEIHTESPESKPVENDGSSIGFINALSQTFVNDYRPRDRHPASVNFVTAKREQEQTSFGGERLSDYDTLTVDFDSGMSAEGKEKPVKSNFEETNRAEDGLTSSDTILAPIQAAVSLSNHVQTEGKKKSIPNTVIEQQEIRVEPVLKTTIEIQKSIPFEIKEVKPEYNQIPNFNPDYEKPDENVPKPGPYQNDFLQQVALAYHKLSNNGEYQTNLQIPQITTHQPQPQNYVYFYRNRLPQQQQPLYLFPVYNKAANDFSKGHVGQYIMQQSYKNLGFEHPIRPFQYQGLKYQNLYPSVTRPLTYGNFYDLTSPLLYQPNVPVINQNSFGFHKGQVQTLRVPQGVEQSPNQHLGAVRGSFEEGVGIPNEEEVDAPSTEESVDTTEEIKQGTEIHLQEAKQEILQEPPTEPPPPPPPPPSLLTQTQPQHHQQHISEPQRIPNNQPYPYGYSFIYPITTTDFRSQNSYLNYHRRGKTPPFRPSHPMYTSQYPPHTYVVASTLPERGIHARSINNKKLCIEYGGFKPPLVPSIQIDDEFEKEAQDKSSKDE